MKKWKLILIFSLVVASYWVFFRTTETEKPIVAYVVEGKEQPTNEDVILARQLQLKEVKAVGKLITLEQTFERSYTDVDTSIIGDRHTDVFLTGTIKLGIHTEDLVFQQKGEDTVHVTLPKISMLSFELPYNQIFFTKQKGWLRQEMNEEERRAFYNEIQPHIQEELMQDMQLQYQAELFTEKAVEALILQMTDISYVRFSYQKD